MKKPTIALHPFEFLDKANKTQPKAARIEYMKAHGDFASKTLLQLNFNEKITLDLPEGAPPYKEAEVIAGHTYTPPKKALANLGYLVPGAKTRDGREIPAMKKEQLFVQTLEKLHKEDAKILIAAKDKNLTEIFPNITKLLIKSTYPEIL